MAKKEKQKSTIKLPRIQKELTQCQMCGYCIDVCEAHRQSPWESVTARGKIYYLNQLDKAGLGVTDKVLGRKAKLSPEFVDAMYKCTGCGNCEAVCHAKIELVALWEKIRKWMADQGVAPLPVHRKLEASIAKNGNPYGEPKSKRDAWWPADVERVTPPQVVFFAGCTGSYRMQNIPRAAVKVLSRAGVTLNCLGENEVCCTSPLLRTGINMLSLEANKEVVTKADALGAKDMVMSCSGCYKTVSSNYVEYYGKPGQNVYHITQYVDKLITERKLPLNNEFNAKVTYHDPCHLGRHSKVYEEPRNILKKIKGIEFVEMEKNRENSRCCGAGGGYKSAFNDFAVNIAAQRIRDAEAVGAEVIATSCPFCVLNLKHGAKKIGSKVKVMDITEILLDVTGPKPEPVAEAPKEEPKVAPVKESSMDGVYAYAEEKNAAQVAAGKFDEKRAATFSAQIAAVKASDASDDEKAIEMSRIIGGIIGGKAAAKIPVKAEDENIDDDFDEEDYEKMNFEVTPEGILRRAAWNKGLRCRKNYGDNHIQIAFVKSKVAVFVTATGAYEDVDGELKSKGWTVLRYKEEDITDGLVQAEEIKAKTKENLRTAKKKKKKR